jgi:hypothetical protein
MGTARVGLQRSRYNDLVVEGKKGFVHILYCRLKATDLLLQGRDSILLALAICPLRKADLGPTPLR